MKNFNTTIKINSNLIENDKQEKEYILRAVCALSLFIVPTLFFILQSIG